MLILKIVIQIIAALGIYNVWLVRSKLPTPYRGKNAPNLKQEFLAYGLPKWSVYVIGAIKIISATGLIAGIWIPKVTPIAAITLTVMMLGAVSMHIKIKDSVKKTIPAVLMLVITAVITLLEFST